jgi:hypothetical protein
VKIKYERYPDGFGWRAKAMKDEGYHCTKGSPETAIVFFIIIKKEKENKGSASSGYAYL